MKAARLLEYGGQLMFTDVQTPTIARDEILLKIKSTAVNHVDLVKASGTIRQIMPIDLPWIRCRGIVSGPSIDPSEGLVTPPIRKLTTSSVSTPRFRKLS